MKYFIKSLLLLSCFFLAIGCEFENYFKSKKLPKELGDGLEFTVKLTGPGSAYIDACSTAITVVRVDNDDNPISLPEAVTTSLNPQSGTFHTTSDCSDTAITSVTIAANESSEVIYWKGDELGTYLLSGSKIAEGLSIEVLPSIPAFSFAKDVFTMTDGGNSIAEEVTIVRPGVGTSQSVTFEIINLFGTGTISDITSGQESQTITFAASETSKVVSIPLTAISRFVGDRYYLLRLSNPTNGATIGEKGEAVLNILEEEHSDEKFFFPKPLFTVDENNASAKILIQRFGDTNIQESISLVTIDASAKAGNDFDGNGQVITFGVGEQEVIATVPIFNNSSEDGNRSFFLELKDNGESAELKTRSWSTTKVRILDDEENLSCDESKTTEFGGGSGVLGNPYLICNKEQLELVASNLDKHFKVTKDIDIEGVGRIEGIFKGVFDGNEHILKNHQLQIAEDSSLFYKIGGAEATIKGINLLHFSHVSSGATASGIVALDWNDWGGEGYFSLNNNLISGVVQASTSAGGLIGEIARNNDSVLGNYNNFMHGLVYGREASGGMVGRFSNSAGNPSIKIDSSYTNAIIASEESAGGIVGSMSYKSDSALFLSNSHVKGAIYGVSLDESEQSEAESIGGILGTFKSDAAKENLTLEITNSSFEGKLFDGFNTGGVVGSVNCQGDSNVSCRFHNISSRGKIFITTEVSNFAKVGGTIGELAAHNDVELEDAIALMDMDLVKGSNVGGVVGSLKSYSSSITLQNLSFQGDILAPAATSLGGVIGYSEFSGDYERLIQNLSSKSEYLEGTKEVGGIFGTMNLPDISTLTDNYMIVENLVAEATQIKSSEKVSGGIFGRIYIGEYRILDTTSIKARVLNLEAPHSVGGISGEISNYGDFHLSRASFIGGIVATIPDGDGNAAGILGGYNNCYNSGNIEIRESFVDADIWVEYHDGGSFIAGLGECATHIYDSYTKGTFGMKGAWGSTFIGWYSSNQPITINNSYSSVEVTTIETAEGHLEAIATRWSGTTEVDTNQVFFLQESGVNDGLTYATTPDAQPKTSADLQLLDSDPDASNWDFDTIWQYTPPLLYPTLRNNPEIVP